MDWSLFWTWVWQASLALLILGMPVAFFVSCIGTAIGSSIKSVEKSKQDNAAVLRAAEFSDPFSYGPKR